MKIEINPMLGKIRGTIGGLVFKQFNGKTVVCNKPSPRSKSSFSPAEIDRQKRFALNCKLSQCINHIDEYKQFWLKSADRKMNTYNAIQKANYQHIQHDRIEKDIHLTPDSRGLDFSGYGFSFDSKFISLELKNETIGVVKDYKIDNNVMFAGVIYLSNPKGYVDEEVKFINVKSGTVKVVENQDTLLCLELNSFQSQQIENYNNCIFYFGFISKDKDGKIINEVSTFAGNLHLE